MFNEDLKYAKEICRMIISLKLKDFSWSAYFSLKMDIEFLELLKQSGCNNIYISFDTFSERMIKNMQKQFSLSEAIKLIDEIHKIRVPLKAFILFGGPGECEDTIKETCTFLNKYLRKEEILISIGIRILPNSKISKEVSWDNILDLTFYEVKQNFIEIIFENLDKQKITFDNFWRLMLIQKDLLNCKMIGEDSGGKIFI